MAMLVGHRVILQSAALALSAVWLLSASDSKAGGCPSRLSEEGEEQEPAALLQTTGDWRGQVTSACKEKRGATGAMFTWLERHIGVGLSTLRSWAVGFPDKPDVNEVSEVLKHMDTNRNGAISKPEFETYMCTSQEHLTWIGIHMLIDRLLQRQHTPKPPTSLQQQAATEIDEMDLDRAVLGKTSPVCGVVDSVCILLVGSAGIATTDACVTMGTGWMAACEAAGGGPEDPLADACAGFGVVVAAACESAVAGGAIFGIPQCEQAASC